LIALGRGHKPVKLGAIAPGDASDVAVWFDKSLLPDTYIFSLSGRTNIYPEFGIDVQSFLTQVSASEPTLNAVRMNDQE